MKETWNIYIGSKQAALYLQFLKVMGVKATIFSGNNQYIVVKGNADEYNRAMAFITRIWNY